MPAWIAPAITAAMGLIGGATAQNKDKRQREQQKKLNDIENQQAKHLALFNQDLQMQMWRDTGPVGQIEQLKKAGLNPGLIYGMAGAGAGTTAAAGAHESGTGQAPAGSGMETEQWMGMGMQMALINAQKENIEADTKLKETTATKTSGVDTKKAWTEIDNIKANTNNTKAQQLLAEASEDLMQLEIKFKNDTMETMIATAENELKSMQNEFERNVRRNAIELETYEQSIGAIKEGYTQIVLENALLRSQKKLTDEQIRTQAQQTLKLIREGVQSWEQIGVQQGQLSEEKRHNQMEELFKSIEQETGLAKEIIEKVAQMLTLGGVIKSGGGMGTPGGIGFKPQK